MDRKIDLVYLWVDGNDKNWRTERDKWKKIESGHADLTENATSECRWRDNDELKYSLRSAAKFAPWINHIYIVTCMGQVPEWLNTKNPKITIVDHSEIMPADALPTFSSNAIESCIINIPGLSEYFLMANDDTFFGNYINPSYFFDENGRTIVWYGQVSKKNSYAEYIKKASSDYMVNIIYTIKLFENIFNVDYMRLRPSHNIEPYCKSRIKELLTNPVVDIYKQSTIRKKFRDIFVLQRWIFTLYDIAFGNAILHRIRTRKRKRHIFYNFINKINGKFKNSPIYTTNAVDRGLKQIRPALFCINDIEANTEQQLKNNKTFLCEYFPEKSEFEK